MNYLNNKFIITVAILCCSFSVLMAQTEANTKNSKSVRIEFDNYFEWDELDETTLAVWRRMRNIMDISDIQATKIDITGELKYSAITLKEHYVRNGVDSVKTRTILMSRQEDIIDSIFSIEVFTRKVDSVKQIIRFNFPSFSASINYNRALLNVPYYLRHIVVLDNPTKEDVRACLFGGYNVTSKSIPFIVFSPGQEFQKGCWDICRVQGTGYHPSLWYEKFDIQDYIYFEIEFLTKEELGK